MASNLCDHLIDYMNGDLDEQSRQEFEEHLKECKDCSEELEELQSLTEDLPYASEPVIPPDGMKERILPNVFAEDQGNKETKVVNFNHEKQQTSESVPLPKRGQSPKRKMRWWTPVLAAALLLSLVGNGYMLLNEKQNHKVNQGELGISAAMKSVQLQSTAAMKQSQGNATLLKTDDGRVRVVVQAKELKPLKGNNVYQVWLIDKKKPKHPYRAGTFVPDQNGGGAVSYKMDLPKLHSWDQIAISQEPTPNSKAPKGQIILASKL